MIIFTLLSYLLISKLLRFLKLFFKYIVKEQNAFLESLFENNTDDYPTPTNLTFAWGFGTYAGTCLAFQILSGISLAMHYTPDISLAFHSIIHIMLNVKNGWLIRDIHAYGASMFFILVYIYIFRGLYFGAYMRPRQVLWCSSIIIFILMLFTAFTGYVLPWSQLSFWIAKGFSNVFAGLPIIGNSMLDWLWGNFPVNVILKRFFNIHFFLSFVLVGITIIHLILVYKYDSANSLGTKRDEDKIEFYPYFFDKDLFAFSVFFFVFIVLVYFYPNTLSLAANSIPADSTYTQPPIVPQWYFLRAPSNLHTAC